MRPSPSPWVWCTTGARPSSSAELLVCWRWALRGPALAARARVDRLFLYRDDVEPTNSRSERDLRPSVMHRKAGGITKKAAAHSFRRTFAARRVRAGIPLPDPMDWMGHKTLSTTQGYINPNAVNKRKLMEATSL
ncbi:MAG: tyrosine-type recombinase/integrase [Chloroflexi bacterium]|nr:tyrosine-type recombinase/integrase [Chloroflexota bacterium]